jgi:hypothetical protein
VKRREAWFESQPDLEPSRLVFIDETWAKTNMARTHGRAPRGERLAQPVTVAHELARALGGRIVQPGGRRALLEGQTGEALGVDRVDLGALEPASWERPTVNRLSRTTSCPAAAVRTAKRFFQ